MQKLTLLIAVLSLAAIGYAKTMWDKSLTPAVTTLAANSTNTTAGTACDLPGGVGHIGLWAKATGLTGATSGNFVMKFSVYNGSSWTDGASSNIKLTISAIGETNRTVFDHFWVPGATQIRVGQIENATGGVITNIAVRCTAIGD